MPSMFSRFSYGISRHHLFGASWSSERLGPGSQGVGAKVGSWVHLLGDNMYIYIYIFIYLYTYVSIYIYIHVCVHIYIYIEMLTVSTESPNNMIWQSKIWIIKVDGLMVGKKNDSNEKVLWSRRKRDWSHVNVNLSHVSGEVWIW